MTKENYRQDTVLGQIREYRLLRIDRFNIVLEKLINKPEIVYGKLTGKDIDKWIFMGYYPNILRCIEGLRLRYAEEGKTPEEIIQLINSLDAEIEQIRIKDNNENSMMYRVYTKNSRGINVG